MIPRTPHGPPQKHHRIIGAKAHLLPQDKWDGDK